MLAYFRIWKPNLLETIVLAICIGGVAYLVGVVLCPMMSQAKEAAKESAQRALFVEAHEILTSYAITHGQFPQTLQGLPFTFPDGGGRELLDEFHYETDGHTCRLSVQFAHTRRTHSESLTVP